MSKLKVGDKVIVHNPDESVEKYKNHKGVIYKIVNPNDYYSVILTSSMYKNSQKRVGFYINEIRKIGYNKRRLKASRLPK